MFIWRFRAVTSYMHAQPLVLAAPPAMCSIPDQEMLVCCVLLCTEWCNTLQVMDRVVVTPDGEQPPPLGGEFEESEEVQF
jgi:hypothetical protein